MTTPGNFAKVFINGWDLTADAQQIAYTHKYAKLPVMSQNVGIKQYNAGAFDPDLSINGYKRHGQGAITAHNLLFPSGIGNTNDTDFITSIMLGDGNQPVAGDAAIGGVWGLLDYKGPTKFDDTLQYSAVFQPRGLRTPLCNLVVDSLAKGSGSSAVFDNGAESVGMVYGGVGILQVYTPTGTAAAGSIGIGSNASDGDTVVIGGVTYTAKTALGSTAGQFLIGATAAATLQNLFQCLLADPETAGTNYIAGAATPTTVYFGVPSATSMAVTYLTTGTAGNAFTLVKTGAAFTVSGATLSGGVAGETSVIKIQTATSSGGSYTDRVTFVADGTRRLAERIEVAVSTTLDRFVKVIWTNSGSTMNLGFNVIWGVYYGI